MSSQSYTHFEVRAFRLLVAVSCGLSAAVLLVFFAQHRLGIAISARQLSWHLALVLAVGIPITASAARAATRPVRMLFAGLCIVYAAGMTAIYSTDIPEMYTLFYVAAVLAGMCQDPKVYRFGVWTSLVAFLAVHLLVPGVLPATNPIPTLTLRYLNFVFLLAVVYTVLLYRGEFERAYNESQTDREAERQLALTDFRTGLGNPRFLNHYVESRSQRGLPVGLVMMDLDGFKLINDRYGHPVGDAVLSEIGRRLRDAVRSEDRPVRYGGDEFCVLLPTDQPEVISSVARRCWAAIQDRPYHVGLDQVVLTACWGSATMPPCRSRDELLRLADENLYLAKRRRSDRDIVP